MNNSNLNLYERGSEWRKWDLHVHTPDSIANNQYRYTGDQWEGFVDDLTLLSPEFAVIGINDYIFIDGYRKILEAKQQNKLSNIHLFLPVLEFRLEQFAGQSETKRINLHIIFSNEISPDDIETRFINKINIKNDFGLNGSSISFPLSLTKENYEKCGKAIRESNPTVNYGTQTDMQIAHTQISFKSEEIFGILNTDETLKDKYLIAIGYSEWQDLRNDSAAQKKKQILKDADFLFCSSADIEAHKNAKNKISEFCGDDNFILLDCSDSHHPLSSKQKDRLGNCNTWVKADPTFEGLKQTIIQPNERIFVGEKPIRLAQIENKANQFIKTVNINKVEKPKHQNEKWFDNTSEIPINSGMVAIIGGKGSGKSALADIVGHFCYCGTMPEASFLNEERFRKSPKKYAEDYEGSITWANEHSDPNINLMSDAYPSSVEKAQYLPQKYIEKVCNDLADEFQEEIDKVIFSYIPDNKKMSQNNLNDLINARNSEVDIKINALCEKISEYAKSLISLQDKKTKGYKAHIKDSIKSLKDELASHKNAEPTPALKPENQENIQEINQITFLNNQVRKRELRLATLNKIFSEIYINVEQIKKFKLEITNTEENVTLLAKSINKFLFDNLGYVEEISLKLDKNINFLDEIQIKLLDKLEKIARFCDTEGKTKYSYRTKIEALRQKRDKLVQETNAEQQHYQKYLNEYKIWGNKKCEIIGNPTQKDTLRYFIGEQNYLNKQLDIDFANARTERENLIKKAYEILNLKTEIYEDIYTPVKQKLGEIIDKIDDEIQFTIDKVYEDVKFDEKILSYINQQVKSDFKGKTEGAALVANLKKEIDLTDADTLITFIGAIFDKIENSDKPSKLVENRLELYQYLLSLRFLKVSFSLKMAARDISELSAGEKGILLLVFYLALNKESKPLIIDQPEDNLDNQSVFDKLVPCICEAKNKRQVIVVTHNPNIAIACDAEQVIHCTIDKKNNNEINYVSGSIENPTIREHIIDILEGTEPAFTLRKRKYHI